MGNVERGKAVLGSMKQRSLRDLGDGFLGDEFGKRWGLRDVGKITGSGRERDGFVNVDS